MVRKCRTVVAGFFLLVAIANQVCFGALSISDAINACADRLDEQQIKTGGNAGSWPLEAGYTGSIVAGLVGAYEAEGDVNWKVSAELGGDYILAFAKGNFYGDEAFALSRLSQVSDSPSANIWRTVLGDFYFNVTNGEGGTGGYISQFSSIEPSTAVFYIANHVVAAYYVSTTDRLTWRQALINYLAKVDDSSSAFSVLALGVATWALASTGPLDNTLIDPSGAGAPYWSGKRLRDLPGLLVTHQVPAGELYAGSFYWRFDHTSGGSDDAASGYTEDSVFASLGLVAAAAADPALDIDDSIHAAREALLEGVDSDGTVSEHLSGLGAVYYAYAGEMVNVLSELVLSGWVPDVCIYDLDDDDFIGPGDFSLFACCWLHLAGDYGCSGLFPCVDSDFDCDGLVGPGDLSWFATGWLKPCGDPSILLPPCRSGAMGPAIVAAQSLGSSTPDVRLHLVTLLSPSPSDMMETLPSSVRSMSEGQDYFVEVWTSDVGQRNTGLTSVYADAILGSSGAASVRSISHGDIFTVFTSGTVYPDRIDELGGSSLTAAGIEPCWVRVATVEMHAEASGPVGCYLAQSSTRVAALGRGLIPWSEVSLSGGGAPPVCGDPDHPYPIGDLDHDCYVSWPDMGVAAFHWLETGCVDFGRCAGVDLDVNDNVDLGDFCLLADHWLECSLPVCD